MAALVKIVIFSPKSHADQVRQAMGDAGAGRIGAYSYCSYSIEGTGRYKPLEGARPAIGEIGRLEKVLEERIECVCDRDKARQVIESVRKVHPYDEMAFDVYPLLTDADL